MYSQWGEDDKIAEIWSDRLPAKLLDIGAWGVKDLSNSRLFIDRGWEAVLVEFSPGPVRALVQEYGKCARTGHRIGELTREDSDCQCPYCQQRVKVIAAAVTPCNQHLLEFSVTDDALSTADAASRKLWDERGGYFGQLWVPTLPVEALISQFAGDRDFDFVSIDTEGTSVPLAIEYLHHRQPAIMCVEHDGKIVELMEAAQACNIGYTLRWTNQTNVILARI